jgi:hypothetical protein
MRLRLFVVCVLSLVSVCSAAAQDSVRLRFQIVKDGAVLANPEVSVGQGSVGRIEIKEALTCEFTPTLRDSQVSLVFDITAGEKHLQPRLVIERAEPGTVSWTSASGAVMKITVVAVR